jgi:hypothetical protein
MRDVKLVGREIVWKCGKFQVRGVETAKDQIFWRSSRGSLGNKVKDVVLQLFGEDIGRVVASTIVDDTRAVWFKVGAVATSS